jgi:hypothetical protein
MGRGQQGALQLRLVLGHEQQKTHAARVNTQTSCQGQLALQPRLLQGLDRYPIPSQECMEWAGLGPSQHCAIPAPSFSVRYSLRRHVCRSRGSMDNQ